MEQRRNAIVELVNREGSLSFVQLKEAFPSVSEMTLRTDLKALDQARRVVRVHGGVKSVEVVVGTDDQFGRRTARNASEKQIIAEKAAALLRPNTTVFLDSGSTATAVARCVPDEPMLIFTSGLTCATIREAVKIQSFPDDYVFCGNKGKIYTQIGNAVPCKMAEAVAKAVIAYLDSEWNS